jgi:hypothetical protein
MDHVSGSDVEINWQDILLAAQLRSEPPAVCPLVELDGISLSALSGSAAC